MILVLRRVFNCGLEVVKVFSAIFVVVLCYRHSGYAESCRY